MKKLFSKAADFFETLLMAFFVAVMLFTFCFRIYIVKGESMENTLMQGDTVIVERLPFIRYKQGDIIVADIKKAVLSDDNGSVYEKSSLHKVIVKRVIAVGGQTVDIDFDKGRVYVDGRVIREDYISGLTHSDGGAFTGKYPVTVPDGYLFVLGDNRRNSLDSRSSDVGFVSVEDVVGRVIFRTAPSERSGAVK